MMALSTIAVVAMFTHLGFGSDTMSKRAVVRKIR